MAKPIQLNIGGGNKRFPEWINVDVDPSADIQCDVRNIPLPDDYADVAMAIHVIEHFYHYEVQDVLAEWFRILKPGAALILECPNLEKSARALVAALDAGEAISGPMVMWPLYGDPRHVNPYMCHKWGYIPDTLKKELLDAGFENVRQEPAQFHKKDVRDMRIVGVKPCTMP